MLRLARGSSSAGCRGALRFEGYSWDSNPRPADYESGFTLPGTSTAVYSCRSGACADGCIFPWTRMDRNSNCNYPD
jgi:hypothetical protein